MQKVPPFHAFRLNILVALLGFGLLICAGGPLFQVQAADITSDTLTISPPRFELFGNPGDTVVEKLRVRNDGTASLSYNAQVEDFKALDDEGGVALIDPSNPDDNDNTYALAKWITVEPARFTLEGGKDKTLEVAIKIPKTAEPGGHFASVLIRRAGTATPGGASVETRVGSLILLRVSGTSTENASIDFFKTKETMQQYGPVVFELRVKNDGNVHILPTGKIVVTNIFGKKVGEDIPLIGNNVLPGAARIMRMSWDQKGLVGRYTATLVAQYGNQTGPDGNPKTLTATTSFVVFPLYILWVSLAVIILLILVITQRKQLRKLINRITSD